MLKNNMIILNVTTLKKSCALFAKVKVSNNIKDSIQYVLQAFKLIHKNLKDLTTSQFQVIPVLELQDLKELYKDITALSSKLGYCIGFHNFLCNLCKTALYILYEQDEKRIC